MKINSISYSIVAVGLLFTNTCSRPANDACHHAIHLTLDGDGGQQPAIISVVGTTEAANRDDISTSSEGCSWWMVPVNGCGVWYTVRGSGTALRASTCTNKSGYRSPSVAVFTGECGFEESLQCTFFGDCGFKSLQCTGDYRLSCGDDRRGSRAPSSIWFAQSGEFYFIYVYSDCFTNQPNRTGDFHLTVDELISPENDRCEVASGPVEADGSITAYSTVNATTDLLEGKACSQGIDEPGVWFTVVGTGIGIGASIAVDSRWPNFAIFSGECDELECIDSHDHGRRHAWVGEAGVFYRIWIGEGTGNLTLHEFVPAANNRCVDGLALSTMNSMIEGSVANATIDHECSSWTATGVWYTVTGEGSTLKVSVCAHSTETWLTWASVLVAYGDCDDLQCVGYSTTFSSCINSSCDCVSWFAEAGEAYHILVQSDSRGPDFSLTLEEPLSARNDRCVDAIGPLPINGDTLAGSTALATIDASPFKGSIRRCSGYDQMVPGVWYSTIGTGGGLQVTICLNSTATEIQVSVHSGDRDELVCIGGRSSEGCVEVPCCAKVSWSSCDRVRYHLLIQPGDDREVGLFGLTLDEVDLPPNEECFAPDDPVKPDDAAATISFSVGILTALLMSLA